MSQITYRGNLLAKIFPFISEFFGRSVIIPGPDQNFVRYSGAEELSGIPQLYYCHNVMPTFEGFQSVGYTQAISDNKNNFENIFILQDTSGNKVFFSHASDGKNYVLPFGGISWIEINSVSSTSGVVVSSATINGQSYIYFANVGCFIYDAASNSLINIVLTGLDTSKIKGITSSSGYLIAWTDTSIAWSSTVDHVVPTDPIDFVPSLVTGAGGGNVESAKGKITLCAAHYLGFIIYTTDNAVSAVYSGNSRYPFTFREIVNSGGLANSSLISLDAASGNHYAYTTSGLQIISSSQTQTVFPEITDFIAGRYFEDFDETTNTFVTQILTSPMKKAITVVADRYLIISYGVKSLTHALAYDTVQKRFGKLKVPHVCCFEWKTLSPEISIENPRQSLGFLKSDGSIVTVDFSYIADNANGVMVLGKYQLSRTRLLTLEQVELENIKVGSNFTLYDLASLDGKNLQPAVEGFLKENTESYRKYLFHQTGVNHSLLAKGAFYCSSVILSFHVHGRR